MVTVIGGHPREQNQTQTTTARHVCAKRPVTLAAHDAKVDRPSKRRGYSTPKPRCWPSGIMGMSALDESQLAIKDLLCVDISVIDDIVLLSVAGELDVSTAPTLGEEITRCTTGTFVAVIVDLSEVNFMASAGMSVLLEADWTAKMASKQFGVVVNSRVTRRPMELLGLDQILNTYPTLDAARWHITTRQRPPPRYATRFNVGYLTSRGSRRGERATGRSARVAGAVMSGVGAVATRPSVRRLCEACEWRTTDRSHPTTSPTDNAFHGV